MGLFDFFKRKHPDIKSEVKVNVNFTPVQATRSESYTRDEQIALFLHFMDGSYPVSEEGYYNYNVRWHCGNVTNPNKLHKQLIQEGYFVHESFEKVLNHYKVQELKDIAGAYNISVKGLRKAQLVEVLSNSLPTDIRRFLSDKSGRYVLSEKAYKYLENYKVLIYLADHRDFGISYSEFKDAERRFGGTYRDVIWRIFNDEMCKLIQGHNFSASCIVFESMAKFLLEEEHFKEALRFYLLILYFNVNRCSIQSLILTEMRCKNANKSFMMEMVDNDEFNLSLAKRIVELADHYEPVIAKKVIDMQLLPFEFLPNKEFVLMVSEMMSDPIFDSSKYMEQSKKEAIKKIKALR